MKPMATPSIQVSYQPEIAEGEDFGIFVRPRHMALLANHSGAALSMSWRQGADYLVYDRLIRTYAHDMPRGEWTAIGIPWPNVSGLLTFELMLHLADAPSRVVASGEIITGTYRRLRRRDLWVYGWSTPAYDPRVPMESEPVPDLRVSLEPLLQLEAGPTLSLVSVAVDTAVPPEAIVFERFPFDFGAGRVCCDVPHGPEPISRFLLPISSAAENTAIPATFVGLGGFRRSATNLSVPGQLRS